MKKRTTTVDNRIGDAPIQAGFVEKMRALGLTIDEFLNGENGPTINGFVLLTFKTDLVQGGRINYISNCQRQDVISAMREQVAYLEGMPYQEPPEQKQ